MRSFANPCPSRAWHCINYRVRKGDDSWFACYFLMLRRMAAEVDVLPQPSRATPSVLMLVTANAKRDQVLQCIVAELTARLQMMDLQISLRAAALTTPDVFRKSSRKKVPTRPGVYAFLVKRH